MVGDIKEDWHEIYLSPHFQLREFYISDSFPDIAKIMHPTKEEVDKLCILCNWILEPVRQMFGPVKITSGVRQKELNDMVGGASTSQHCRAMAVDFIIVGRPKSKMVDVYNWLSNKTNWPGELFYYRKRGHVHIGIPEVGVSIDHGIISK